MCDVVLRSFTDDDGARVRGQLGFFILLCQRTDIVLCARVVSAWGSVPVLGGHRWFRQRAVTTFEEC